MKGNGSNFLYNLVGAVLPVLVTFLAVPLYLRIIGEARFGVLSLVWLIFGYFGLFDFGLSRATANRLARLAGSDENERNATFYTALAMNGILGVLAGLLFYFLFFLIFKTVMGEHSILLRELSTALPWLAALIPLALIGGVFTGSLEAEERFLALNIQQSIGAILQRFLPLGAVMVFGGTLEIAIMATAVARVISVVWNGVSAMQTMIGTGRPVARVEVGRSLLNYGFKVAVTNAVGPILVSSDQFLIAALLGASAVAYYVVPFNLAMKMLIIPSALSRALFPRFSSIGGKDAKALADRASAPLSILLALICAPAILLAKPALVLWVGEEFAAGSYQVAQLLIAGTWVNGIAIIPFTLLQAQGRPGIVAKLHVLELLPFLALIWLLIKLYGLPGAALAWCLRVAVDAALLFWVADTGAAVLKRIALPGALVCSAWLIAELVRPSPWVAIASSIVILGLISRLVLQNADLAAWIRARLSSLLKKSAA